MTHEYDTIPPTDPHASHPPHAEPPVEHVVALLRAVVTDALAPLSDAIARLDRNQDLVRESVSGMRVAQEARIADLERRVALLERSSMVPHTVER